MVGALLARGLIREQVTDSPRKADAALNTIWRNEDDGRGVLLFITPAGLEAIGVEREPDERDSRLRASTPAPTRPASRPRRAHGGGHGAGRARAEETGPAAQGRAHGARHGAHRARPATGPSRRS